MKLLTRIVLNAIFFLLLSAVIPGYISVDGFSAALVASLLFAIVNSLLKPLLVILTLPLNILTFGAFTFVINGFLIYLVSVILKPKFGVSGFFHAIIVAILLSAFNILLNFWNSDE